MILGSFTGVGIDSQDGPLMCRSTQLGVHVRERRNDDEDVDQGIGEANAYVLHDGQEWAVAGEDEAVGCNSEAQCQL